LVELSNPVDTPKINPKRSESSIDISHNRRAMSIRTCEDSQDRATYSAWQFEEVPHFTTASQEYGKLTGQGGVDISKIRASGLKYLGYPDTIYSHLYNRQ
jgi:hypothetical protein